MLMWLLMWLLTQTFEEADLAGDGIISLEEWRTLVCHSPDVIGYMTLPVLKDVTVMYPSFIFNPRRRYERSRRCAHSSAGQTVVLCDVGCVLVPTA